MTTQDAPGAVPIRQHAPGEVLERSVRTKAAASSRSLLIVSDLTAALEYDERTRQLGPSYVSRTPLPTSEGGLPPPPRSRSRPKMAHNVVAAAGAQVSVSLPSSPSSSSQLLGRSEPPTLNPYINPVPRFSLILRKGSPASADEGQASSPDSGSLSHESSHDVHNAQASPASASPTSARSEGVRHQRGLSSLQRVEKMLAKSKRPLAKLSDASLRSSRRASDVDMSPTKLAEKAGKDKLLRQYLRVLERGKGGEQSASAPSSPTVALASDVGLGTSSPVSWPRLPAGRPFSRLSAAAEAASINRADASPSALSHAREGSDMSLRSLPSSSSYEPPSASTERHISISSTIYPSSQHSFDSSPRNAFDRSTAMHDDNDSFIDLTSPTFSPPVSSSHEPSHKLSMRASDERAVLQSYSSEAPNAAHVSSAKPHLPRLSTSASAKPPLPTTPKPNFRRSQSAHSPLQKTRSDGDHAPSPLCGPRADAERTLRGMPSTTNLLRPEERAELVRKTRKLAQVFGQTPGSVPAPVDVDLANGCLPKSGRGKGPGLSKRRHKQVASMLHDPIVPVYDAQKRLVWPPGEDAALLSPLSGRRRSVPLSPRDLSSMAYSDDSHSFLTISKDAPHVIEIGSQEGVPESDWDSHPGHAHHASTSPTSFIDLSDDETPHDALSAATPKFLRRPPHLRSPSTPSLIESFSSEHQAEVERRRKREKLAKLHRFLGSRIPVHLVLGPLDEGVPLPPPASSAANQDMFDESEFRRLRVRRRRSSSAAEFSATWSDEIDRLKDDLNDREKAINVRRAVKMEKARA
ncbi:uncharacterized protein FIBRA_05913 [Fibroporia radiculosa]|uniref:Uncharacterized protein n=1 Tax=Fibroporia radiculosa TaxID=599839 RepID=J4IAZ4_9APHY|nr:uncharacterized protein FIBRA_05913 [Fibroporia radiculosa]CCM03766.1 predicted protein [Fibroporia radiculosa]